MAFLASILANKGKLSNSNFQLLSEKGWNNAMNNPILTYDYACTAKIKTVNAGWHIYDKDVEDNRNGFVGWQGYGGSW